jgi:hypothetical protein
MIKGLSTAVVAVGLAGCNTLYDEAKPYKQPENSYSKKEVNANSTSNQTSKEYNIPPAPINSYCDEYEWDHTEGYYECIDVDSDFYHHYYHKRKYYRTPFDIKNGNKPVFVIGQKKTNQKTSESSKTKKIDETSKNTKTSSKTDKTTTSSNKAVDSNKSSTSPNKATSTNKSTTSNNHSTISTNSSSSSKTTSSVSSSNSKSSTGSTGFGSSSSSSYGG